ncbi:MAG: type II secretion system F family protein [Bacteroidales bacterium]|nr:type II secretion system F family protein [Bacteroidales bacterium]
MKQNSHAKPGKRFPRKKKQMFYEDISRLLSSGVNIVSALELVKDNFKSESDKAIIEQIHKGIYKGYNLSVSMEKCGVFSVYEVVSIQIGEESGQLGKIMAELESYYKRQIEQQKKITTALSYPAFVFVVAIMAVAFMLSFVVPLYSDIFSRYNQELPLLTKKVIAISEFISAYGIYIFLFILSDVVVVWYMMKKQEFRLLFQNFILRIPIIGEIIRLIYLSRFCSVMELLMQANVPLSSALDLSRNMITFNPLTVAIKKMITGIELGGLLSESMSMSSFFDKRMAALITVGEEVNQLEKSFGLLKEQYNKELDQKSQNLNTYLEPVIIIFIGVFIGLILVSMYLPIFKISSAFEM